MDWLNCSLLTDTNYHFFLSISLQWEKAAAKFCEARARVLGTFLVEVSRSVDLSFVSLCWYPS